MSLSAWGEAGPWRARRGFDSVVQCSTGIAAAEGADGAPGALPAQILDHATGYLAAAAAMLGIAGVERGAPPRSARLSLAQTADWLMSAGVAEREPEREMRPGRLLVNLSGAARPVQVISPPGGVGDLKPRWAATTQFGTDPPVFSPRPMADPL